MSYDVPSTRIDCPTCCLPFSVPTRLWDRRAELGDTITCPSGHPVSPRTPDEVKRLRAEIDDLKRKLGWRDEECSRKNMRISHLEHVNAGLRGHLGRLKKGRPSPRAKDETKGTTNAK